MKNIVLASTAIFLSGCVATMPQMPGVLGSWATSGMSAAAGKTAPGAANSGGGLSGALDQLKVLNKPMTAKELFANQGTYKMMASLQEMQKNPGKANSMANDLMGAAMGDTGSQLRIALKMTTSYLSYAALDGMMASMSENPAIMNSVVVDVPQVGALGHMGLQAELMGVAKFLAAMKASNLMVGEGGKRLELAKTNYQKVLAERDQLAATLGVAALTVNGAFELPESTLKSPTLKSSSNQNLAYLRQFYGKPFAEVRKDPQAVALINAELEARYPNEYKPLLASEQQVTEHYREYAKTANGTLSMMGFAAMFLNNAVELGQKSDAHKLLLSPMIKDGVVEMGGVIKNVIASLNKNDELVDGTFSLTMNGKVLNGITASKVISSLDEAQVNEFKKAIIGNENVSYMGKLDRRCSDYAADILDRLVDGDKKASFAKAVYKQEEGETFSFKMVFDPQAKMQKKEVMATTRNVRDKVYNADLTGSTAGTEQAIGEVQNLVRKDIRKLTNQDIRRIMLIQDKFELVLGSAVVRMEQPGLQGLADRQEMNSRTVGCQVAQAAPAPSKTSTQPRKPAKPPKKPSA